MKGSYQLSPDNTVSLAVDVVLISQITLLLTLISLCFFVSTVRRSISHLGLQSLLAYFTLSKSSPKPLSHPRLPSPPSAPLPLLEHILSISPSAPWKSFASWSKTHGPVFLVRLLGSPMVVVNTLDAAHELLEKRGANMSGRPRMAFFNEWLGWKDSLGFIQHNDSHRRQRRLVRPHVSARAVVARQEMLYENARILVDDLKASPDEFTKHVLDYVSRTVVNFTYGYTFTSANDPRQRMVDDLGQLMIDVDWSVLMVLDAFPFVEHLPSWLPFMHAKRTALKGNALRQRMSESFFEYVQEARAAGAHSSSLISRILDDPESEVGGDELGLVLDQEMRNTVMSIGTMMYLAGVETTNAAISTFLLAMVLHPHVARLAQQEIDGIIGLPVAASSSSSTWTEPDPEFCRRVPSFADRKRMPYVESVLMGVLRWNPPAPLDVAHRSERADEYRDMEVPGDCSVVANIWHMCHDDTYYHSPHEFKPERFLPLGAKDTANANATRNLSGIRQDNVHPKNLVFGFGRRVCPGEHLADAILWIAITSILANFDVLPVMDGVSGEAMVPEMKFTSGSLSRPEDFKCRFVTRHAP